MDKPFTKAAAAAFFSEFFGGPHHCPPLREWGDGWAVTCGSRSLATYDSDGLTRLVFMAHDRCVRVEVMPVNMQRMRIAVHARERTGQIWARHPTLKGAVDTWRRQNPEPEETDHG